MTEKTIETLYHELNDRKTTSQSLVRRYLKRIEIHDGRFNSLADLNAGGLQIAAALDRERARTGPRSLLHGIPIIIKDNLLTKDGMRTTCNARVFKDFHAPYEATVVQRLKAAGAIILAKANLSEFAYMSAVDTMPWAYGALHGFVVNPYDTAIDPLGSSNGSAVSVAADFAPVAIGTETNGSLMLPSRQCNLVSIKPTMGLVSRHGIIPISLMQDIAGPIAKTVSDAAIVLDIIRGHDQADSSTDMIPADRPSYHEAASHSVKGKRIGLLRLENKEEDPVDRAIVAELRTIMEDCGASVKSVTFNDDMIDDMLTLCYEFKRDLNRFLTTIRGHVPVETLSDIIAFNLENPSQNIPYGQKTLLEAQATDARLKSTEYLSAKRRMNEAIDRFKTLFKTHGLDAIATTKITSYPPVGGLPSVIVPARPLDNRFPKSLVFIGLPFEETSILPFAKAYETATNHRIPPVLNPDPNIDNS